MARDRRRACRLAHVFGASIGAAIALAAGLLADLAVRPTQVLIGDGRLMVCRLGRSRWVDTGRLTRCLAALGSAGHCRGTGQDRFGRRFQ